MKLSWILLISLMLMPYPVICDTIILAADYWMPYNGDGEKETGYMLDLAKMILSKQGHSVQFKAVPWSRAIDECRKGTYNGIIGAYKVDAPDFVFPENEEGYNGNIVVLKKGNTFVYNGTGSLKGKKLGVIKDYAYFDELNVYIEENKNNKALIDFGLGDTPLQVNLKKLLDGKIDLMIEDSYVISYLAKSMNITDKITIGNECGEKQKIYIAFSPAHPKSKEYARFLSQGIIEFRKNGTLKIILDKYGLKDWK